MIKYIMNGDELKKFVENFPSISNSFVGIYSINTIPKRLLLNHFLICNTSFDYESGSHWICFLRQNKSSVECFDSLGLNFDKQNLVSEQCHFRNIKFNQNQFQPLDSKDCGKFVLYFAINRMHNLDVSFNDFLKESFYANLLKNNEIVNDFVDHFNGFI